MDEALTRLRADRTARPAVPSPSSPSSGFTAPALAVQHVVAQLCVCAVFDLPFLDRFERQASGIYRPVESRRVHDAENFGAGAEIGGVLNADDIKGAYMPCPWCGDNGNMRYHCDCGGVICGGKVKGKMFHCRASCGASWPMGNPVREIEVTEERGRREWQAPPPHGSAWQAPPPHGSAWQAPAKGTGLSRRLLPPGGRK